MGNRSAELEGDSRGARHPAQLRRRLDADDRGEIRGRGREQGEVHSSARTARKAEVHVRTGSPPWNKRDALNVLPVCNRQRPWLAGEAPFVGTSLPAVITAGLTPRAAVGESRAP